jgi:hypothetical protein
MLRAMNAPEHSGNDRRAVPRHLRDGENDLLSSTGVFGQRSEDAVRRRGIWVLVVLVAVAAGAAWWFWGAA